MDKEQNFLEGIHEADGEELSKLGPARRHPYHYDGGGVDACMVRCP